MVEQARVIASEPAAALTNVVDLKFLSESQRVPHRNFKSKTTLES
jgi:hypothetical protein